MANAFLDEVERLSQRHGRWRNSLVAATVFLSLIVWLLKPGTVGKIALGAAFAAWAVVAIVMMLRISRRLGAMARSKLE